MSRQTITIAVRALVNRVLRSGDLTAATGGRAQRAALGARLHRAIQRQRPAHYRAEVSVSARVPAGEVDLIVRGRIDGVYTSAAGVVVEEIKSTGRDLNDRAADPPDAHWGQAQVYGYLFALEQGLDSIDIQLTYVHIETREVVSLRRSMTMAELTAFFDTLVAAVAQWAERMIQWAATRDASVDAVAFPFPEFRAGQRDLAVAVYRAVENGSPLVAEAATGIGKTMAVLFSTLKAGLNRPGLMMFYLTARGTGQAAARDAVAHLAEAGLRLKTLVLTAKEKLCVAEDGPCEPAECPRALGHFDRVNDAVAELMDADLMDRDRIHRVAGDHQVCPFELSLEAVPWVDLAVGDVNYAFDPRVHLRRLFDDGDRPIALLVDEAHNLVDRARDMYSAELFKQPFLDSRKGMKKGHGRLFRAMGQVSAAMAPILDDCRESPDGGITGESFPEALVQALFRFLGVADAWLQEHPESPRRNDITERYFEAAAMLRVVESDGPEYRTIAELVGKDLRVNRHCLDPARFLDQIAAECHCAVFFSATLQPLDHFIQRFGLPPDTAKGVVGSPFDPERLGVFMANRISTVYRHREKSADAVADTIAAMADARTGNYLVFFPSYVYLKMVLDGFRERHPHHDPMAQEPSMSDAERGAFLTAFDAKTKETRIGFAVLGGVFGEGIDLVGERLTGVAIVGVGLPGISAEQTLLRDYFENLDGTGFETADRIPGMIRVRQAGGRVIRSSEDKGVLILIDQRYTRDGYRRLLSPHWRTMPVGRPDDLTRKLTEFWSTSE